jgi:hypothetical protein
VKKGCTQRQYQAVVVLDKALLEEELQRIVVIVADLNQPDPSNNWVAAWSQAQGDSLELWLVNNHTSISDKKQRLRRALVTLCFCDEIRHGTISGSRRSPRFWRLFLFKYKGGTKQVRIPDGTGDAHIFLTRKLNRGLHQATALEIQEK